MVQIVLKCRANITNTLHYFRDDYSTASIRVERYTNKEKGRKKGNSQQEQIFLARIAYIPD